MFHKIWIVLNRMISPHSDIIRQDDKRRSRLLSAFLLLLVFFSVIMVLGYEFLTEESGQFPGTSSYVLFAILIIFALSYWINKAGRFHISAVITILCVVFAVFILALPVFGGTPEMLYYLIFPILISSFLLPIGYTAMFVLVSLFGLVMYGTYAHLSDETSVPLMSMMLISVMVLLTQRYTYLLEMDRRNELKESEERFKTLVFHAPEAIMVFNAGKNHFTDWNQNAESLLGLNGVDPQELNFKTITPDIEIDGMNARQVIMEKIASSLSGEEQVFEWVFESIKGDKVVTEVRLVSLPSQDQQIVRASIIDISREQEVEEKLTYLATHDLLTDLPNRSLFIDRVSMAILDAKRKGEQIAVVIFDLDNFKDINEALSFRCGDKLLKTVAKRLSQRLRSTDTISRFNADEFGILLTGIQHPANIIPVVEKIHYSINQPFFLDGKDVFVTSSSGISVFPGNGDSAQVLVKNADTALTYSKRSGKNKFQFFSTNMETRAIQRVSLSSDLRRAIDENEFALYYQPQIEVDTGKVFGVEALIRWMHPEKGIISPKEFLPIAEENGLICKIGQWVVTESIEAINRWDKMGFTDIKMAINLSERQLKSPDFASGLKEILKSSDVNPEYIELELSENIILHNADEILKTLFSIKELGMLLAVDDFGTGYSTMSQLAKFPFDTLKVDQSFSRMVAKDKKDALIVAGIMEIARGLGLKIVAEGVEEEEQYQFFRNHGCDLIQGWYFSRALPEEDLLKYFSKE